MMMMMMMMIICFIIEDLLDVTLVELAAINDTLSAGPISSSQSFSLSFNGLVLSQNLSFRFQTS